MRPARERERERYSKVAVKRSPSRDPQTMKSTKNTKKVQNLGKSTYMKGTRRPEIVEKKLKSGKIDIYERDTTTRNCKNLPKIG